jgi:uncharacterized protein (DUF305 family)
VRVVASASLTDVVWAQLTVALNERALRALGLVVTRSSDSTLISLVGGFATAYRSEAAQLREHLTRLGVTAGNPHEGHDMPGMANAATLDRLRRLSGADVDALAVEVLVEHIDQCLLLAASEQEAGSDPTMTELAGAIEATRRAQREALVRFTNGGASQR